MHVVGIKAGFCFTNAMPVKPVLTLLWFFTHT